MNALDRDPLYAYAPLATRAVYGLLFEARARIVEALALGVAPERVAARVLGVDRDEASAELDRLRAVGLVGDGLTLLAGVRRARSTATAAGESSPADLDAARAARALPIGWRIVPGFPGYRINESGVVIGLVRGIPMKTRTDDSGYRAVTLHRGREVKRTRIHRLVAAAFIGPCPAGLVVNHRDGNKLNNHRSNLEYVTPAENVRHASRMGLLKTAARWAEYRAAKKAGVR